MPRHPNTKGRQRAKPSRRTQRQRHRFDYFPYWVMLGIVLALIMPGLLVATLHSILKALKNIALEFPMLVPVTKAAGFVLLAVVIRRSWLVIEHHYQDLRQWSSQPALTRITQLMTWVGSASIKTLTRTFRVTQYSLDKLLAGNALAWVVLVIMLMLLPLNPLSPVTSPADSLLGIPINIFPSSYSSSAIAPLFTDEVDYWGGTIQAWADEYQLDPNLLATVIQIESCGHPYVSSHAGASGLFQVMPYHFDQGENRFDPDTNARRASQVLQDCLTRSEGDPGLALACYNGGPSVIGRDFSTWAGETQRYYGWGLGIYADARRGRQHSDTLDEWLEAGGSGLCRSAGEIQH